MIAFDPTPLDELKEIAGEDASLVLSEIISSYLDEAPHLLQELYQSWKNQDCSRVKNSAHSLKSSSAAVGAMAFSNFCKEIESLAKDNNLQGIESLIKEALDSFEIAKVALEKELLNCQQ